MKKTLLFVFFTSICNTLLSSGIKDEIPYEKKEALVSQFFKRGQSAYETQNYSKALYWFQKGLLMFPDDVNCLTMAANACGTMELYSSAIYYYIQSLEILPNSIVYNNLGITYGVLGYDDLAIEAVKPTEENSQNSQITIGAILYRHGKYEESISYMRKALELGDKKIPLYNIGIIFQESGKSDSAVYYFDRAMEIDPSFADCYNAKAVILQKVGRPKKEYEKLAKKAISLISKNIQEDNNLQIRAECYKLLGEKKKMEKDLKQYLNKVNGQIELYPDAYPFIMNRADRYENLGEREAAISDYQRVLELNPECDTSRKALNKLLGK